MTDPPNKNIISKKVGLARLAKAHRGPSSSKTIVGQEVYSEHEESIVGVESKPELNVNPLILVTTPSSSLDDSLNEDKNSSLGHNESALSYTPDSTYISDIYIKKLQEKTDSSEILSKAKDQCKYVPNIEKGALFKDEVELKKSDQLASTSDSKELYDNKNQVIKAEIGKNIEDEDGSSLKLGFFESIKRHSFRRRKGTSTENLSKNEPLVSENQLVVPKTVTRSHSLSLLSDALESMNNSMDILASPFSDDYEAKAQLLFPPLIVTSESSSSSSPSTLISTTSSRRSSTPLCPKSSRIPVLHRSFPKTSSHCDCNNHMKNTNSDDVPSLPTRLSRRSASHNNLLTRRKKSIKSKLVEKCEGNKDIESFTNSIGDGLKIPNGICNEDENCVATFHHLNSPVLDMGKQHRDKTASWHSLDKSNDASSQESYEDVSSEECDSHSQESEDVASDIISSRRWSSLGKLSSDGSLQEGTPLGTVRMAEARQKSYLFGGLGSLLGPTELDRYFPSRVVTIFIATWNMNGKEPPMCLDDFLLPDDLDHMPDMYVIGTQESGCDRTEWEVRLQTTIGPSHVLFTSALLGILHLTVFLRRDLVWFCTVPEEAIHSLRPGTYFKTKGAVAISFQFFGTKILFINTHLFAHEEKLTQRIQNYRNIIHNLDLPRNLRGSKLHRARHRDVTHRYDVVFWMGDLNFRLVGERELLLEGINLASESTNPGLQNLMQFDQLTQAKIKGEIFQGFTEGAIHFLPTFKFDIGTNDYDTSSKQRVPSYTDRILFRSSRDPIICSSYYSCPLFKTSDHKPVCGVFHFKVRPGKDDVPLAAGFFNREVYLAALRRRRRFFHQPSSRNCQMQ